MKAFLRDRPEERRLSQKPQPATALSAWFLGPKGENEPLLQALVALAVHCHCEDRRAYYPEDPVYITPARQASAEHQSSVSALKEHFARLLAELRGSTPFWSYRWQSHMNWDLTLPSIAGYFAAMLYNPNNVAAEASPVTTTFEMKVGDDLCQMLGYPMPTEAEVERGAVRPWGHITCDGSVANLEAMWAARNLKYYPLCFSAALQHEPALEAARGFKVPRLDGQLVAMLDLDTWTLLNLKADDVLAMPARLLQEFPSICAEALTAAIDGYTWQSLGGNEFARRFLPADIPAPVVLAPSTMHYSWPKNAAILGLGKDNVRGIHVNTDARMRLDLLREALQGCLEEKRPVIMAVCVIGSTEESAVDPLAEVLALREEFRRQGLDFAVHADAAWGGYFASMLIGADRARQSLEEYETPFVAMSDYVNRQYHALPDADSITVDPHKSGYSAYPAGALCYRHSAMRNLVSFTAPVIYHGGVDPTVGIYGVEGSKPGAAAAGVFLSHRVIPATREGFGKILGKSLFNSKRLYAGLTTMAKDEDPFILVPLQRLPAEREGGDSRALEAQKSFLRERVVPKTNREIMSDRAALDLLREIGSDQIITTYAFNVKTKAGLNEELTLANTLNQRIFERLSLSPDRDVVYQTPMIVTSTEFSVPVYGTKFVEDFARRLGLRVAPQDSLYVLLSTTMNPWLTDTAAGDFIPTLIAVLRESVLAIIHELNLD
jgi:glutamate/tyrosine decarboxylase-like PLP-dependent enzyme